MIYLIFASHCLGLPPSVSQRRTQRKIHKTLLLMNKLPPSTKVLNDAQQAEICSSPM